MSSLSSGGSRLEIGGRQQGSVQGSPELLREAVVGRPSVTVYWIQGEKAGVQGDERTGLIVA